MRSNSLNLGVFLIGTFFETETNVKPQRIDGVHSRERNAIFSLKFLKFCFFFLSSVIHSVAQSFQSFIESENSLIINPFDTRRKQNCVGKMSEMEIFHHLYASD